MSQTVLTSIVVRRSPAQRALRRCLRWAVLGATLLSVCAVAAAPASATTAGAATDVETLKAEILALNRDLTMLREELLYPAHSQVMVFLSVDVGAYFQLQQVTLKIDDQVVTTSDYAPAQVDALQRGGVQRLYVGNLPVGSHELTAFFAGLGPSERPYRRGASVNIIKRDKPTVLELQINDAQEQQQPAFSVRQWGQ